MGKENAKAVIASGKAILGIEFGSTRIKAVLVGSDNEPIASGAHDWENRFENGVWTYSLDDIWTGLQDCYADLLKNVKAEYDEEITNLGGIGFSAMMHGYMAFDKAGNLMVPFRTWRNTITGEASEKLTKLFNYHIPQRWSIAHLYQAMLNGEDHVKDIDFVSTLAGYVHYKMTGKKVLGVGEASGMFPIDIATKQYYTDMVDKFDKEVAAKGYSWKLLDVFPAVAVAGDEAGTLTEEGAKLLDVSGKLSAGIPLCPPEGDAGTGMVATNSVKVRTGNVSAGTSIFGMVVLEKELTKVYDELDLVTTPSGDLVAMAHCNNCTSDLNAWMNIFKEVLETMGVEADMGKMFTSIYTKTLDGDKDCGGLLSYNYFSGEHITGFDAGRPLFVRQENAKFNLANFMRSNIYASMSVLKTGLDILIKEEGAKVDCIYGHGGLFKTKGVAQSYLAAAIDAPVSVMATAGEGGAWGIAVLASYLVNKKDGQSLEDFLQDDVFHGDTGEEIKPDPADVKGFNEYLERYTKGLAIERAAVESI